MAEKKTIRKKKPNKNRISFLTLFVPFGLLAYFIFYVYFAINAANIETHTLDVGSVRFIVEKEAVILRDEQVLTAPSQGYISYTVEDGDRVRRLGSVARIQNEELKGDEQENLQIINRRISELQNNSAVRNPEQEIQQIDSDMDFIYLDIQNRIINDDIEYLPSLKSRLETLIEKRKLISGASSEGDISLEELQQRKNSLEQSLTSDKYYIKANDPGVFSLYSDGFNEKFTSSQKLNLSVSDITSFKDINNVQKKEQANQNEIIGTIVNNHTWYFACEVTADDIKLIEREKPLNVYIDDIKITAVLEEFYKGSDQKFVGIFRSSDEGFDFTKKRKHTIEIEYKNPKGLLVPKQALVSKDGKKGIFTVNEVGVAVFKEFTDLRGENEEYFILGYDPQMAKSTEVIGLYDEAILSVKGIKDGQRVR